MKIREKRKSKCAALDRKRQYIIHMKRHKTINCQKDMTHQCHGYFYHMRYQDLLSYLWYLLILLCNFYEISCGNLRKTFYLITQKI